MNLLVLCLCYISLYVIPDFIQGQNILVQPRSLNVSLGKIATFHCTVRGGPLYWLINEERCNCVNREMRGALARFSQVQDIHNSTLRINSSRLSNNTGSTVIKCVVVNIDGFLFESNHAILRIQGLLGAPQNVSITRNASLITLVWVPPLTLDLTNQNLHYLIFIENVATGRWRNVTTVATEYVFQPQDDEYCTPLRFCVTPVNIVGEGNRSECVTTSLERGIVVESPRNSSVSLGEQISMNCRVTCAESSVVTWLINGRPLNMLRMKQNFQISNNYITECTHSQNHPQGSNYTEVLDVRVTDRGMVSTVLDIQCVSVYICRDGNCFPSTCLSQRAYLTVFTEGPTSKKITTTDLSNPNQEHSATTQLCIQNQEHLSNMSSVAKENGGLKREFYIAFGIAIGLGITLLLTCTLGVCKLFLSKVMKKSQKEINNHENTADAIYAQCEDPTAVRYKEVLYDHPKTPSPQPPLQPCEAYSVLPDH